MPEAKSIMIDFSNIKLTCPQTNAELFRDGDWFISRDAETRFRYPVRDDIPVLVPEHAEQLDEKTWTDLIQKVD